MESSAIEALISLAGQDTKPPVPRVPSPVPVKPAPVGTNIIRKLQTMSDRYINDEPILKESEKIEMFSEIPTSESEEEESLEVRRLRCQAELQQTSEARSRPQICRVYAEHSYSMLPSQEQGVLEELKQVPSMHQPLVLTPSEAQPAKSTVLDQNLAKSVLKNLESSVNKERVEKKKSKLAKINNSSVLLEKSHEREKENIRIPPSSFERLVPPSSLSDSLPPSHHYATPTIYRERDLMSEMEILYEFLTRGIDHEDVEYLRRSYEALLADDTQSYWLNDTHWVDHPATDIPSPAKRRKRDEVRLHVTGCARTEGYYKVDLKDKLKHKVSTNIWLKITYSF